MTQRKIWTAIFVASPFLIAAAAPLGVVFGTSSDAAVARSIASGQALLRVALALCGFYAAYLFARRGRSVESSAGGSAITFDRGDRLIAVLLVVVGLSLHLYRIDSDLAFDEIWMWDAQVRKPLAQSLARYESDNNHPLYSFLAWISTRVFSDTAGSLRLPAAIFGALNLSLVYFFGRRFFDRATAGTAAAVLGLSYHHIWFAQNARGYTALLFFALLSSDALVRVVRHGRRRDVLLYGIAAALATWSHLTGVFIVASHFLIQLAAVLDLRRRGEPIGSRAVVVGESFFGAALFSFTLHAPMLPAMLDFFTKKRGYFEVKPEWRDPFWTVRAAIDSLGVPFAIGAVAVLVAAAVFLVGLRSCRKESRFVAAMALLPAILLAAVLLSLGRNLWPRMFFFLAGFLVLVGAAGATTILRLILDRCGIVDRPRRRRIGWACLFLVGIIEIVPARKAWFAPKQDFLGAKRWVEARREPGQEVVTCGLASFAYGVYFGPIYRHIDSSVDLAACLGKKPPTLLVFVSKIHLESWDPQLWAAIRAHGTQLEAFPGTMGQEPVVVVSLDQ